MHKMNLQRFATASGLGTVTNAKRYNVSEIVFALMTKDDEDGTTYGTVESFGGPQEIVIAPKLATGQNYEGGVLTDDISKVVGYDITVGVSKLQVGVRSKIFGHKFTANGEMIVNEKDMPVNFALGYKIDQTEGKQELVWLFKCMAQPYSVSTKQSESNINFSPDSIKISAVKRKSDGHFELIGDTNNATFTDTKAATFLDSVPTTVTAETA